MTQRYDLTDHSALHMAAGKTHPLSAMRAMQNVLRIDEERGEPLELAARFEALFYLAYSANSYALDAPLP